MATRKFIVAVTTASDGTATAYSPTFSGEIRAVHYLKTDFANGVDFTITAEATGESIWTESDVNASKSVYPRVGTHKQDGTVYAGGDVEAFREPISLGADRVKIVIAQGGNTKSGNFHFIIKD